MSDKVAVELGDFAEMQQIMFKKLTRRPEYQTDEEYRNTVDFLYQASADSISTILKMGEALGNNGTMGEPGDGFIIKEKKRDYKSTN